ncbi:MAG: [protein-PII] uridylyltransferase [Candidatus Nanopelagicales bacterium]
MSQIARTNARALPIGRARRLALAQETDRWLKDLFANVVKKDSQKYALVAIGGYGRSELTLGSDLDLLLLHENGVEIKKIAEAIWYPIWDENIKLDHSVRTISESRNMAANDLAVFMGLLDARCVAGNDNLIQKLTSLTLTDWRSMSKKRLPELKATVEKRILNFGQLSHLIEPNLKESYGGLREVVILNAIAASWITDVDRKVLFECKEVLLQVRDALHQVTNSKNDVLIRQEQPEIAKLLGYRNSEFLLRDVAAAAKSIAHLSDLTWHRVEASQAANGLLNRLKPQRTPLADGVVVQDNEVLLAKEVNVKADPNLLLRAAAATAQAGLIFAPFTLDRFKAEIAEFSFPLNQNAQNSLISLLGSGKSLIPIWDSLDENGLIEKFLPIWQRVRSLPQSSPVHIWTVDRHLLETVVSSTTHSRDVARPDLLFIACLLHDIGKGEARDHTEVGVELALEVLTDLGFNQIDTAIVIKLIQHHLLLAEIATKRDLQDPATIEFVKIKVENSDFLELLYALTLSDAAATGPLVNTQWRNNLITQLYEKVKLQLTPDQQVQPTSVIFDEELNLQSETDLFVDIKNQGVNTQITVAVNDQNGLLSKIAAALSLNHLEIRSAKTKTINNKAITIWQVNPVYGDLPDIKIIEADIRNSLSGSMDTFEKLESRASYQRINPELSQTRIDEIRDIQIDQTLLEVRTHDRVGLLATLAQVISQKDIVIQATIVQTLGSEAIDVFYLTEQNGEKLRPQRVAELIEALDYACIHVRSAL